MPSLHVTHKRIRALSEMTLNYPMLWKMPMDSQTWDDWVYEVAERYECGRRTAVEYMRTVAARQKRLNQEYADDLKIAEEFAKATSGETAEVYKVEELEPEEVYNDEHSKEGQPLRE